jgi:hypothetical protein
MTWIVAALLALQSPVSAGEQTKYWSWLDGQRFEFVVPPDTVRQFPWVESADAPPLAPRAAIRSAERLLPQLVPGADEWTLREVQLQPVFGSGHGWVYLITFVKSPPPNVMWDGPLPSLRLVVLMDGTAVVPTVTSDTSNRQVPEVPSGNLPGR